MPNMNPKKCPMPEQAPDVRNKNFEEVTLGYTAEMAVEEAQRCLNCKNKPCMTGCPVQVKIPEFIALVAEGNNVYRVATADDTNTVTEIETDATGKFTIKGLDSDIYYLTETAAPAGYNKLAGPITIVIGEDGKTSVDNTVVDEVKVLNQAGSELPETGGMGTTIFYVLGSILVLGAAVLLITKKRMNAAA